MKALITGASSGIGRDVARELSKKGYDLILVARDENKLQQLKQELTTNIEIVSLDLSNVENCKELYEKHKDIDILINNAGFGDCGKFWETDLDKEIQMIQTNIIAYHVLTKLYLKNMKEESIREELRKDKSKVQISILCPGPVNTNFNKVANVEFDLKGLSSEYVAKYAMNKLLKGKFYIVPGLQIKLVRIFHRFIPASWNAKINYNVQRRKIH